MDHNLDEAVMNLRENHPYLGVVMGGTSLQAHLIVERCVLEEVEASSVFTALIGTYFTFNMNYPKPNISNSDICTAFFVSVKDKQQIPISLTKFMSSLDKLDS